MPHRSPSVPSRISISWRSVAWRAETAPHSCHAARQQAAARLAACCRPRAVAAWRACAEAAEAHIRCAVRLPAHLAVEAREQVRALAAKTKEVRLCAS